MTEAEKVEVLALCPGWVQPTNQEGGTQWMADKAEREQLRDEMVVICKEALENNGYTPEQISLFFPTA